MCEDIFTAIERNEKLFTRLEQTVARYVLTHSREVLNQSISELACSCGVAVSTVFRFCRQLGFSGYREFLLRLAATLEKHEIAIKCGEGGGPPVINELYQKRMISLRETCRMLSETDFDEIISRLKAANRILLAGVGSSLGAVINAYQRLLSVNTRVVCSLDARIQKLLADSLTEKDVMIAFSYSGETPEVLSMAEAAKRSGAYLIALTHFSVSALGALADRAFISAGPCCEPVGKAEALLDTHAFIMDVLCSLYAGSSNRIINNPIGPSQPEDGHMNPLRNA